MKYITKSIFILFFLLTVLQYKNQNSAERKGDVISLLYGKHQQFKYRHGDINILGHVNTDANFQSSYYKLNEGKEVYFYIKGTDEKKDEISRNRLDEKGDFNIEIPVSATDLSEGINRLDIFIEDVEGKVYSASMTFNWEPEPASMPLNLKNLSGIRNIQEIGQVVNGDWEVDAGKNVIRSRAPVGRDALLLLGSPYGSQEATYSVMFRDTTNHLFQFQGLSDFFAGHEASNPPIGIKPGWSSAGLATIRPHGAAQAWLAWGDLLLDDDRRWAVKTEPPKIYDYKQHQVYHVRHQVIFKEGLNTVRFKIWAKGESEPEDWLCEENDASIHDDKMKHSTGSFGLFQFYSQPTEWFNIVVKRLDEN